MPEESRLSLLSVDVFSVGEEISLSRGGMALYLSSSASTPVHTTFPISRGCFIMRGCSGNRCVSLWRTFLQSIIRYPSTDVGVGRLDDSGVGTP